MKKLNIFLLLVSFFFVSTLQASDTDSKRSTAFFSQSSQQSKNKPELKEEIDNEIALDSEGNRFGSCEPDAPRDVEWWCDDEKK